MGRSIRHDNGILVTDDLTETARHAFLRHDFGHFIVARARVRGVFLHINAIERANVHAELAARTIVHDDLGLRDLAGFDARDEVPVLVLNARDGAIDRAHPAVDAAFGVNDIQLLRPAADRVHRTFQLADRAADAGVCNEICHFVALFAPDPVRPTLRKLSQGIYSSRVPKCNSFCEDQYWLSGGYGTLLSIRR